MKTWLMYVVRCSDGSLYTGVTNNIKRRVLEHNYGMRGAKYTRSRRPVTLVYAVDCEGQSDALKREYAFKKLPKAKKEEIVRGGQ